MFECSVSSDFGCTADFGGYKCSSIFPLADCHCLLQLFVAVHDIAYVPIDY